MKIQVTLYLYEKECKCVDVYVFVFRGSPYCAGCGHQYRGGVAIGELDDLKKGDSHASNPLD